MKRTQIYLTEDQARLVAARADDAGVPEAEVIRGLLGQGLGLADGLEDRRRSIVETAGILTDEPAWPDWLSAVRGQGADARLNALEG